MRARPDSGTGSGPTVLRMLLGAQLRRLRETQRISREDAGWHIRASESKISRMELGRVGLKERDVADLLTFYGVNDEKERSRLLALARETNTPGWWHRYTDVLPNWFHAYLGLEAAASQIRSYDVQFVPGLLQVPEYASAVVRLGHPTTRSDEIERRVEFRMSRKQVLDRPDPPLVWAVLDEAVLRRPVGGTRVMRAQLEALIELTERPRVRIQVIPFSSGGHAAAGGAFSILRFPEPDLSDVVYIEHLSGALYYDKREIVDMYAAVMERLCVEAEPPDRTADILHRILKEQ